MALQKRGKTSWSDLDWFGKSLMIIIVFLAIGSLVVYLLQTIRAFYWRIKNRRNEINQVKKQIQELKQELKEIENERKKLLNNHEQ